MLKFQHSISSFWNKILYISIFHRQIMHGFIALKVSSLQDHCQGHSNVITKKKLDIHSSYLALSFQNTWRFSKTLNVTWILRLRFYLIDSIPPYIRVGAHFGKVRFSPLNFNYHRNFRHFKSYFRKDNGKAKSRTLKVFELSLIPVKEKK